MTVIPVSGGWPPAPESVKEVAMPALDAPPARYYPFAWDAAGYRRGRYVVVPGLTPLTAPLVDHAGVVRADDRLLQADRERPRYLVQKRPGPQLDRCDLALRAAVTARLRAEAASAYGLAEGDAGELDALVGLLQEDVAVVRLDGTRSRLCYLHVSLPSGWSPDAVAAERVSTFGRVHAPLAADMGSDAVTGLRGEEWLRTLVHAGPHRRFTWGLQLDAGLDQHPARRPQVDAVRGLWLRVERQVTVGLPDEQAMLFLIRPYVVELAEARAAGVLADLVAAVRGMDAGQAAYKLQGRRDEVLALLTRP
ncbi:MAG: DUF3445 domain-containing protein [bacterium]|nr:DUF3445 domain-containing protein [bacterium]